MPIKHSESLSVIDENEIIITLNMERITREADFLAEMVRALEVGMKRQITRNIAYSPFSLFYRIFTSANPNLMNRARNYIKDDLNEKFSEISGFDLEDFSQNGEMQPKGKIALKLAYNLAIFVFKHKLTPVTAFKLVSNTDFREMIYNFVLNVLIIEMQKIVQKSL